MTRAQRGCCEEWGSIMLMPHAAVAVSEPGRPLTSIHPPVLCRFLVTGTGRGALVAGELVRNTHAWVSSPEDPNGVEELDPQCKRIPQ